ncbi:AEC family transporter [Fructobacillus americanaquae]|uniref:AEC family transporter n=1 Tax=Fructobacillus americanaquae TaxID=2940302 RepID=A0ABY5C2V1_9LACO|nr:AEC family transporter [Fructobacillus americanaquae]USS91645.1 AEC family transporter [Fructobacillus americanaquae]
MSISSALEKTLTNNSIIAAIVETLGTILLGFFLRNRQTLSQDAVKTLTSITTSVALPLLAFTAFLTPLNHQTLVQSIDVLIWGLIIYVILIVTMPFLYGRYGKDQREVLGVLTAFGSTTFFGMPIAGAVYGAKGIMYASVFNIGYRVFLYSYAYIKMSGEQLRGEHIKKMLVNPIIIATFLGLILWVSQNWMSQISSYSESNPSHVAFYRLDVTVPWLFSWMKLLAGLASPLAWLAIGANLAQMSFTDAIKNHTAWYYSFNKVIIVPIIMAAIAILANVTHLLPVDQVAMATMVIMMATPVATVAVNYAMAFNHQSLLAANTSLISTISATIVLPLWIIIVQLLGELPVFK